MWITLYGRDMVQLKSRRNSFVMQQDSKMTIEKLAVMIQKGFEETAKQIDLEEVKEDVVLIKQRLDSIETELIDIKKKLENVIYRHEFEMVKDRIETIEKKLNLRK